MKIVAIVAEQLSLFGEPPKPGRAWVRPFWSMDLGGFVLPPCGDALRQARLLTPDSHRFDDVKDWAA